MGIVTKSSAADLRRRAEAAKQASVLADEHAGAARAEAARCLADGNAEGARTARARAIEQASEAETQHDLADELHRRAIEAEKAEALAAYEALHRTARRSAADAEKGVRAALADVAAALTAAQAAQNEARTACQTAATAYMRLPDGVQADPPPSPFDPMLTNGITLTHFATLPIWRVM